MPRVLGHTEGNTRSPKKWHGCEDPPESSGRDAMSFPEFLGGVEEDRALKALLLAGVDWKLPDVVHIRLWELLGEYVVTGGMPEVVEAFRDMREKSLRNAFHEARGIQENLIRGFLADMAKHSGRENSMHIERVWKNLPAQLGREINGNAPRYRFKGVIPGRKGYRELEGPIGWLEKDAKES